MNIVGIIPARMASSRFPGKPLCNIAGVSMIAHCYFRAAMSRRMTDLYVATCDREIQSHITSRGGKAVMTADTHEGCVTRTAEALLTIEKNTGKRVDIVVMLQGDEPMLRPEMIDEALAPMIADPGVRVVNLMAPIATDEEHADVNEVKVVAGHQSNAVYFSREPIPSRRKTGIASERWKQVCIIPMRREALLTFLELPTMPLERAESVDMLRFIENNIPVRMVPTRFEVYSVDTEDDRRFVEGKMTGDPLLASYAAKAALR